MKLFGFLATLLLLLPTVAGAQGNTNTVPPACTADTLLTICVPQVEGTIARVTDAASSTVCTGGGSTTNACQFDGSSWVVVPSGGSTWTGANDETITNAVDGEFLFTREEAGIVTFRAADDSTPVTGLTIDLEGAGAIILGSGDVTNITLSLTGDLIAGNAATDSVQLQADTDIQIHNGATGVVTLDLRDYADTDDDDMAHSLFSTDCTTATTNAEECDLNISITTGGANIEVIAIDPAAGIEIGDATTTGFTVTTDGSSLNVEGTTANTLTFTAATTGVALFQGADAASPAATTFDTTGAGPIILGSADVTTLAITNNGAMTVGAAATTDTLALESAGAITLEATGAINIGDASATSVPIITDGGTVTIDGYVQGQKLVVSLASGALTLNAIHLATAGGADYDIPDGACDAAADIGTWVTVVLEDASVVVSITSDDASNIFTVPGLGALTAGDELDSVSHTVTEGQSITLTCLTAENWYFTGGVSMHTDATIAWADGGTAD